VFEDRVLRKIFGPMRDEVTGEYRKVHNEERDDLYPLPNIIQVIKSRIMRWAGHVACIGGGGTGEVHTGFWWGKRPLGQSKHRWEDKIKMDYQKVGLGGMD
jgi:hypothetical protein